MTEHASAHLDRTDPELRDRLAAEYALGTLAGPARRRFERWIRDDPELARAVAGWEQRLAALDTETPEQQPPAAVWEGLQERLRAESGARPAAEGEAGGGFRLWNSLPFWRGLAAAAVLLVAVVAGVQWGAAPAPPARMVVVSDAQSRPLWVISTPEEGRTLRVRTLRDPGMGPERVCPLWLQWGDGDRTRRVGVLPEEPGSHTLRLPADMQAPLAASRVAVSVEPAGRRLGAQPQGKLVFQGDWISL